jgi:hypothetical protein
MYQRDYILRLIERFGKALVALRNAILKREADRPLMRSELADIARQAGLDLDVARRLDPATLLMWLSPPGAALDPPRLWLMAELLYLEGLESTGLEEPAGRADFERALAILQQLPQEWRPSDDFGTVAERVAELRDLLGDRPF